MIVSLFIYFPSKLVATGCVRANVRERVAVQAMIYYLVKSEIKATLSWRLPTFEKTFAGRTTLHKRRLVYSGDEGDEIRFG